MQEIRVLGRNFFYVLRREFFGRPLLVAAVGLAIGLLAREFPAVGLLGLALVLFAVGSVRWLCASVMVLAYLFAPTPINVATESTEVRAVVRVISVPRIKMGYSEALVRWENRTYRATFPEGLDVALGARVMVEGGIIPFREEWQGAFARRGWAGRLSVLRASVVQPGPALWRLGQSWRDSFRDFTARTLSEPAAQLADAVCFNVDGGLDDDVHEDLRRIGIVHIVSASGLHVGIFALFLQGLLKHLPIDRRWQLVLLLAVLLVYMGATGMRPPVVRAVSMAALMLTAYLWRREADLLSALGLAAIGNLLIDPRAIWDLGFQLSFVAVLGLGLFPLPAKTYEEGGRPIGEVVRQGAWVSLVATLATGPIIAYNFGYVSIISVLSNLIASIPVSVVVIGSLAAWGLSWVPVVPAVMMWFVEGAAMSLLIASQVLASFSFAAVEVPEFWAGWIAVAWLLMLGLWRWRDRPA